MSKQSAKIRLQVAFKLARDLREYHAGDAARFDRMVSNNGKGIISRASAAKTAMWVTQHPDVTLHWPVTSRMLAAWLDRWG